jgi:hypothetical protein
MNGCCRQRVGPEHLDGAVGARPAHRASRTLAPRPAHTPPHPRPAPKNPILRRPARRATSTPRSCWSCCAPSTQTTTCRSRAWSTTRPWRACWTAPTSRNPSRCPTLRQAWATRWCKRAMAAGCCPTWSERACGAAHGSCAARPLLQLRTAPSTASLRCGRHRGCHWLPLPPPPPLAPLLIPFGRACGPAVAVPRVLRLLSEPPEKTFPVSHRPTLASAPS